MIDPNSLRRDESLTKVYVDRILANDRLVYDRYSPMTTVETAKPSTTRRAQSTRFSKPDPKRLSLPPGAAKLLEIEYSALEFVSPERTRFRYRLEGHDSEWREAVSSRRAVYTNLKPGNYRFQVIARSSQGLWNKVGESFEFQLAPYFYQTGWFYALCALSVVLIFILSQQYRLVGQRKLLSLEKEAALSRERERLARDMHDDLGTNLTRITLLGEMARKNFQEGKPTLAQVENISQIANTVLDDMGELIWATNPKYDTLANLLAYIRTHTNTTFEDSSIHYTLDFPHSPPPHPLGADSRRHIFLILKEALHNILKHSQASHVTLCSKVDAEALEFHIQDNGQGFDTSAQRQRHGLSNMRERVNLLNGTFSITSTPGNGTSLSFSIPLAKGSAT